MSTIQVLAIKTVSNLKALSVDEISRAAAGHGKACFLWFTSHVVCSAYFILFQGHSDLLVPITLFKGLPSPAVGIRGNCGCFQRSILWPQSRYQEIGACGRFPWPCGYSEPTTEHQTISWESNVLDVGSGDARKVDISCSGADLVEAHCLRWVSRIGGMVGWDVERNLVRSAKAKDTKNDTQQSA